MGEALADYLISTARAGAPAPAELYSSAYQELRAIAARHRGGIPAVAGSNTSLVHEAYLKLHALDGFVDRRHFLATASRAMRHILVDLARAQSAAKRGDGVAPLPLTEREPPAPADGAEQVLDVDRALAALAQEDALLAEVVELRFFGGLELAEIAPLLERSERSLKRDWVKARAFLRLHLADFDA